MPAFEHSAEPRPITNPSSKYRDDAPRLPVNIMKDPRVAKGSTYDGRRRVLDEANAILSSSAGGAAVEKSRARKPRKKSKSIYDYRPSKQSRDDLDLMEYLVEQVVPIAVRTVDTQTSVFEARPDSPEYVPRKTGIDNGTQLSDEVFDFDREIVEMLGVIVGKTMEQALLEVEAEEEIAALEREGERLLGERKKEQEDIELREKESIELLRGKKARVAREKEEAEARDNLRMKVAGVRMMKQILPVSKQAIYDKEVKEKRWIVNDISTHFMPWLYRNVTEKLAEEEVGRVYVDGVIEYALKMAKVQYEEGAAVAAAQAAEEAAAQAAANAARVGKVKINITATSLGMAADVVVGPLPITGVTTVKELEGLIIEWLKTEAVDFVMPEEGFLRLGYEGVVLSGETVVMDIKGNLEVVPPAAAASAEA
jgi:hypothetical protein